MSYLKVGRSETDIMKNSIQVDAFINNIPSSLLNLVLRFYPMVSYFVPNRAAFHYFEIEFVWYISGFQKKSLLNSGCTFRIRLATTRSKVACAQIANAPTITIRI